MGTFCIVYRLPVPVAVPRIRTIDRDPGIQTWLDDDDGLRDKTDLFVKKIVQHDSRGKVWTVKLAIRL